MARRPGDQLLARDHWAPRSLRNPESGVTSPLTGPAHPLAIAMSRVLRFLGLAALFAVTTCVVVLLSTLVAMIIHEWADWGLHQLGHRVVESLRILAFARLSLLVPVIWIAAAALLYLVALGPATGGTPWRTLGAAVGLSLGWYALLNVERLLSPALGQTVTPFDRPLLSAPLLLYVIVAPWVLGRRGRRSSKLLLARR